MEVLDLFAVKRKYIYIYIHIRSFVIKTIKVSAVGFFLHMALMRQGARYLTGTHDLTKRAILLQTRIKDSNEPSTPSCRKDVRICCEGHPVFHPMKIDRSFFYIHLLCTDLLMSFFFF